MILAGTGHRPDKLGGYGDNVLASLTAFAVEILPKYNPSSLISGMALGWDQAIALAAIELDIPFIAAVPFSGQENKWPERSQQLYRCLLSKAAKVEIVCKGGYAPEKLQLRNEWMVDHSGALLALWNGTVGGTSNCVNYADNKDHKIYNVWGDWLKWQQEIEFEQFRERMLVLVTMEGF